MSDVLETGMAYECIRTRRILYFLCLYPNDADVFLFALEPACMNIRHIGKESFYTSCIRRKELDLL